MPTSTQVRRALPPLMVGAVAVAAVVALSVGGTDLVLQVFGVLEAQGLALWVALTAPLVVAVVGVYRAGRWLDRRWADVPERLRRAWRPPPAVPVAGDPGEIDLPDWVHRGGITLAGGPDEVDATAIARDLLAAGARVALIGGRRPEFPHARGQGASRAPEWMPGPVRESDLVAWFGRGLGRTSVVVVSDTRSLAGWFPAERPEARLARFAERLRPSLAGGAATCILCESLAPDRLTAPDAVGRRLLASVDAVRLWSDGRAVPPPEPRSGAAAWLVHRGTWIGWNGPSQRWEERAALLGASVAGLLAALMVCVPPLLARASGTLLVGSEVHDLPGSLWVDWWVNRWLAGDGPLVMSDRVFWPLGVDVVTLFGNVLVPAMSAPFQWIWGYPGFWNPFVVVALATNAVSAWVLARQVGADRRGALLSAVAFALAPPLLGLVAQAAQSWFWAFPVPLSLAFGLRAMDGQRPRDGWIAGLVLAVSCLSSWFYGSFAITLLLAAWIPRWWKSDPMRRTVLGAQTGRVLRAWLPSLLGAGPLLAQANLDKMSGLFLGGLPTGLGGSMVEDRMVDALIRSATSPLEMLLGGPGLAWVPHILLIVLVVGQAVVHRVDRAWVWVVVGSALLALGPFLLPAGIGDPDAGLRRLPLAWLQGWVPFLARLHDAGRLLVLAAVGWSVLVGLAHRPLALRLTRGGASPLRHLPFAAGLAAIVATPFLLGSLPVSAYSFAMPRYYSIMGKDEGVIVEVPLGYTAAAVMYQPLHGHPLVGGPGEDRLLAEWGEHRWTLSEDAVLAFFWNPYQPLFDPASLAASREAGLRYIVVHADIVDKLNLERPDAETQAMRPLMGKIETFLGPPVIKAPGVRVYRLPEEISWPTAPGEGGTGSATLGGTAYGGVPGLSGTLLGMPGELTPGAAGSGPPPGQQQSFQTNGQQQSGGPGIAPPGSAGAPGLGAVPGNAPR